MVCLERLLSEKGVDPQICSFCIVALKSLFFLEWWQSTVSEICFLGLMLVNFKLFSSPLRHHCIHMHFPNHIIAFTCTFQTSLPEWISVSVVFNLFCVWSFKKRLQKREVTLINVSVLCNLLIFFYNAGSQFCFWWMSEQLLVRLTKKNSSREMYSPIRWHAKNKWKHKNN